jgi:hypothetical protein
MSLCLTENNHIAYCWGLTAHHVQASLHGKGTVCNGKTKMQTEFTLGRVNTESQEQRFGGTDHRLFFKRREFLLSITHRCSLP